MPIHQWPEIFGYLAAGLLLLTFFMQQMAALRAVAIASSIAWLVYGWADHIYPVLCLHMILLPLNTIRLYQAMRAMAPPKAEGAPARSS
jgi:CRP/FNR family transcriptional regulator, cyclic AMP receptor protein